MWDVDDYHYAIILRFLSTWYRYPEVSNCSLSEAKLDDISECPMQPEHAQCIISVMDSTRTHRFEEIHEEDGVTPNDKAAMHAQ